MNRSALRTMLLASVAVFSGLILAGCGVQGKYTDQTGMITLQLDSGGKASFAMAGQKSDCTYKVEGDKVPITCEGRTIEFTKQSDGSLAPMPGIPIGVLKKQ
jgi:hypothetical protein